MLLCKYIVSAAGAMLNDSCVKDDECQLSTNNTLCLQVDTTAIQYTILYIFSVQVTPTASYCKCLPGYQSITQQTYTVCVPLQPRTSPSLASLVLGLILLTVLLCFMLRLFSKERWSPARLGFSWGIKEYQNVLLLF